MLLKIDLQEIPKIKPSSLHLRHLSCKLQHVTNTTALFKVPFEGCGTVRGTNDRYIKFANEVENSLSLNESRWVIVRHVPEFHFPFMCYYRPKYVISMHEGERREKGNDSGEHQKLEGDKYSAHSFLSIYNRKFKQNKKGARTPLNSRFSKRAARLFALPVGTKTLIIACLLSANDNNIIPPHLIWIMPIEDVLSLK